MLDFVTKEQLMAQKAFARVSARQAELSNDKFKEYKSFAFSFPSLIHSCGLAQAIAFAVAKKRDDYISDLEEVFSAIDSNGNLQERSRNAAIMEYMRISRHAVSAASWIKRYCQAAPEVNNDE